LKITKDLKHKIDEILKMMETIKWKPSVFTALRFTTIKWKPSVFTALRFTTIEWKFLWNFPTIWLMLRNL
jgi:hypothetical protein